MLSFQNNTPALLLPGFSLSHGHESTDLYLQGSITDQGLSCCTLNPLLWVYRLHISFSQPMAGLWQQTSSWRPSTALTADFGLKTAWQFWRILLGLRCGLGHFHPTFLPSLLHSGPDSHRRVRALPALSDSLPIFFQSWSHYQILTYLISCWSLILNDPEGIA